MALEPSQLPESHNPLEMKGDISMELTKELKERIERAQSKEEAKKILEDAGIVLDDAELDQVAGGYPVLTDPDF